MLLSLIGMSNVGKTHWSKQLEQIGFTRFGCDDEIERMLGIKNLSEWMGFPDSETYRDREKKYLETEETVLKSILDRLPDGDIVIDTTGSIIYLTSDLLERLKSQTKIVYLQANQNTTEKMIEKFFSHPKPVIWGEHFQPRIEESSEETLRRCYPKLLEWRQDRYAQIADLIIPT